MHRASRRLPVGHVSIGCSESRSSTQQPEVQIITKAVLVHGIGQQLESAAALEACWLPALAEGLVGADFVDLAATIRPPSRRASMAFYGDLFLQPDQQGDDPGPLTEEESLLAEQLAREWLRRARDRGSNRRDRQTATRELAFVEGKVGREEMGWGEKGRWAVNGLSKLRWFAPAGFALAKSFVNRALAQVTRYFTDPRIRRAARDAVLAQLGPETAVVVAHSLGSVVAYEAMFELERDLPLLVTIGSPLGLQTIVYDRLEPQPPRFPARVRRWVNVADLDDFVAAEPDLTEMFDDGIPPGASFEPFRTVDNGAQPHDSTFYLRQYKVGEPVGEVLSGAG